MFKHGRLRLAGRFQIEVADETIDDWNRKIRIAFVTGPDRDQHAHQPIGPRERDEFIFSAVSDDFDPFLKNIFDKAERPLENQAFMRELLADLTRVQRGRTRRRMAFAVAAVVVALLVMPAVLEQTAAFVRVGMSWMESIPAPVYWAVSMLIGIWVMVRTGRLGRR